MKKVLTKSNLRRLRMAEKCGKEWPIIDAHCHVSASLLGEELIETMDEAGVDKTVIFPIPFLWSFPRKDNYYNTNDYIAELQDKYPDRLIGFACINPNYIGNQELQMPNLSVAELERCIRKLRLRGVKIHPENHCFSVDSLVDSELMNTIARLQKEMNIKIPILSHGMTTLGATPEVFGVLASKYPDISIIIAHGAGFQGLYLPSMLPVKKYENLFADTGLTNLDDFSLRMVARTVGVNKIIFGSDRFSRDQKNLYGNFFHAIKRAFPDLEERKLILGANMAKILELQNR